MEWTETTNKKFISYKRITANTSAICQHAVHTTNHHLLAANQELYQKGHLLKKYIYILKNFLEVQRKG